MTIEDIIIGAADQEALGFLLHNCHCGSIKRFIRANNLARPLDEILDEFGGEDALREFIRELVNRLARELEAQLEARLDEQEFWAENAGLW